MRKKHLRKINVYFYRTKKTVAVINDVLIAHKNPAATSRYLLELNKTKEEQRSSGIWIATPMGSTAGHFIGRGQKK